MMGFTGFPTETFEEARETIDFLTDNSDYWAFGGLGEFVLTPGAIIAKDPARFGISNVRPAETEGIARSLTYDEPISQAARDAVNREKRHSLRSGHYQRPWLRPWLSGTDTPHSFFYLDRFRTQTWPMLQDNRRLLQGDDSRLFQVNGELIATPDPEILHAFSVMHDNGDQAQGTPRVAFRRNDGHILLLPPGVVSLLGIFARPTTLAGATEQLWMLDAAAARRTWEALIQCAAIRRVSEASCDSLPAPSLFPGIATAADRPPAAPGPRLSGRTSAGR